MPYALLNQKNPYFRNLSPGGQQRFVERLHTFMEDKYFVGREGLIITDEMRVLISAAAVQLTFGLKDYTISHLHTINVFPKAFYSRLFETSFKGLTTQGGVLSISWNDFKEGYAVENDKLNLGLHELAHALNIDLDEDANHDGHLSFYFNKWKRAALSDFAKLKEGSITFFRKYGGENMHEFFAVCIEHFFEAPQQFHDKLPVLYGHTAIMLNQDPDNSTDDYKVRTMTEYFGTEELEEDIPFRKKEDSILTLLPEEEQEFYAAPPPVKEQLKKFISNNGIYIAMTTTFVGLFLGIPSLIWFINVTIVDIGTVLLLIFVCGILGLLQWKYVRNHLDMEYHHFAMYAFSGFAMCFLNLLLFVNLNVSISGHTVTYDLRSFGIREKSGTFDVVLDDAALARNLSTYLSDHFNELPDAHSLTVKYATGLFGFDRIEECTFH